MTSFVLTGTAPLITIRGHYEASGKFLLLPITGGGVGEIGFCKCVNMPTLTQIKSFEVPVCISVSRPLFPTNYSDRLAITTICTCQEILLQSNIRVLFD